MTSDKIKMNHARLYLPQYNSWNTSIDMFDVYFRFHFFNTCGRGQWRGWSRSVAVYPEKHLTYSPPGAVLHGRVNRVADTPDDVTASPASHQRPGRLRLSQTARDV